MRATSLTHRDITEAMVRLAVRMVYGSMPKTDLPDGAVRFVDGNFSRWMSESNNMMQYEVVARAAIGGWLGCGAS